MERRLWDAEAHEEFMVRKQRCNVWTVAAIEKGQIKRPPACEECGEVGVRLDAHHPDYVLPDLVVFLCRSCHGVLHSRLRREARERVPRKKHTWARPENGDYSNRKRSNKWLKQREMASA